MRILVRIVVILVVVIFAGAAVGCIAMRRGDIPYDTLAQTYAYENSQYAELKGGLRVHFVEAGPENAPVLLLVHGFSASTHTWDPWRQRLSDTFRVVSLDLPGHGLTAAPEDYRASIESYVAIVDQFAAQQNLNRFALAGSSMGGHVSWEYALTHPERVQGLILVDAAGWWDDRVSREDQPLIFRLLGNPLLGPMLRDLDTTAMVRQGLINSVGDPAVADEAMVRRYVELSRAPGHRDILLQITLAARDRMYATPERLAPLAMIPTLIIHGEADNLIPVSAARRFNEAIAGSELVIWPGIGHIPQEEIPDESAAVVRQFLVTRVFPEVARLLAPPPAPAAAAETPASAAPIAAHVAAE